MTINSNWGGIAQQTSLSEVRFFYVPVQAFLPVPADAFATGVSVTASLDWRPGREAVSHKVLFGARPRGGGRGDGPAGGSVAGHGFSGGHEPRHRVFLESRFDRGGGNI